MTVAKDQELRNQLREAGVSYAVVKNTLARKAAEGTALEQAADQFKGVTAVALSAERSGGSFKSDRQVHQGEPGYFQV